MKERPHMAVMVGSGNVGVIGLRGFIEPSLTAILFKDALDELVARGVESILLKLENCLGGSVFEGATMATEIRDCKVPVNAKASGACASMATILFGACKERMIDEMGYLITHRPTGKDEGCWESHDNTSKNLKVIYDEMAKVYASITGMTVEDAAAKFMPFAKDVYLNATEAVKCGLATGTWNSGIKAALPLAVLQQSDLRAVAAFYDRQINPKTDSEMDLTKIAAAVGLAGETDENKILGVVSMLHQQNADMSAKIKQMELDQKTAAEKAAKDYVKAQADAGKITAAEVPHFEKMAITDLDSVKAILDNRKAHRSAGERMETDPDGDLKYGRKKDESDGDFYMRLWKDSPKMLERIKSDDKNYFNTLKSAAAQIA